MCHGIQRRAAAVIDECPLSCLAIWPYYLEETRFGVCPGYVKCYVSGEGGSDSLTFAFVCEDGEQDSVHGGTVLEGSHGSYPSPDFAEASFDGIGGSDLLALGKGLVAEAGEEFVEIVAQAGDGLGVDGFLAVGEAARGALGLYVVPVGLCAVDEALQPEIPAKV